jgi:hypothetical protein
MASYGIYMHLYGNEKPHATVNGSIVIGDLTFIPMTTDGSEVLMALADACIEVARRWRAAPEKEGAE